MRRIKICAHISMDGVIQPPGSEGAWSAPYRTPAGAGALLEAQGSDFDLLLGRRTYDQWSGYWPNVKDGPFAGAINAATKYVVTHRPESLSWGPIGTLGADIMAGIRRVKSMDGRDLVVWGSTTVTSVLFEEGLVDEIVLVVYPVLLGRGLRPFSEAADPRKFELVSTTATATGVLINRYRHVGAMKAEEL